MRSAVWIVSPIAVPPPPGCSCAIAASVSAWSVVGDCSRTGRRANSICPTSTEPGSPRTNRRDAACAAPSREGLTSVADIELETSLASMMAARLTGTATVCWGRAAATISAAIAARKAIIGRCRRHPGLRGVTEAASAGRTNASAACSRRRCWRVYQTTRSGIATSAIRTNGQTKLTGARRAAPPA